MGLLRSVMNWVVFPRTETIRSHNSRAGKPSNLSPVSKENFRFCWAVWNWCLFLVHPTYWHKRLTPENCTMFLLMLTLNLQDLLQNQNLEIIPVDSVVQYFPHYNTLCFHMCDECKISIDSGVCHRPWFFLWLIVQAYLLTIEYQVFRYVPSTNISRHFASRHLTVLQMFPVPPVWIDDHPNKDATLVCHFTVSFNTCFWACSSLS